MASGSWVLCACGATTTAQLSTATNTATKITSKTVNKTATKMVSLLVVPNSPGTLNLPPSLLASRRRPPAGHPVQLAAYLVQTQVLL